MGHDRLPILDTDVPHTPICVAVDGEGNVLVTEGGGNRVAVFGP